MTDDRNITVQTNEAGIRLFIRHNLLGLLERMTAGDDGSGLGGVNKADLRVSASRIAELVELLPDDDYQALA